MNFGRTIRHLTNMKTGYPADPDDSALGTRQELRVLIADDNIYFLNTVDMHHFLRLVQTPSAGATPQP